MKKIIVLLVLPICLLIAFQASAKETITLSTGEWAPWTGKDLKQDGFICHVAKKAFDNAGYEVEFKYYPWKRTYAMVKEGKVDASAFWYESEEKEEHCYYSDPLSREKIVFFYLKKNPMQEWENLKDLKKYKIGVSRGNTYTDRFREMGEEGILNFDKSNKDLTLFQKLLRGRVDIVPATKMMAYKLLKENFSKEEVDSIAHNEKPLTEVTGHLLFPKSRDGSKKLMKTFNEELQKLKDQGTYDELKQKLQQGYYDE